MTLPPDPGIQVTVTNRCQESQENQQGGPLKVLQSDHLQRKKKTKYLSKKEEFLLIFTGKNKTQSSRFMPMMLYVKPDRSYVSQTSSYAPMVHICLTLPYW